MYSIRPKMMLGSVSEYFANLRHKKVCKTCVPAVNALFRGIELSKKVSLRMHPIYSIRPKTKFGCVSEHFTNLRHEKLWKTFVSGLNALFRGTELLKKISLRRHPMYSIKPKMMLASVSEYFADLRHKKYVKHVFRP